MVVTHIYEYQCVKYVRAQRIVKQVNATVSLEDGETKRVLRRVQICIDEDLVNRILNNSETILISILSVI